MLNQSYEDSQPGYSNIDTSKLVNSSSSLHIKHDHTYCFDSDREMATPKRRRISSTSSV